ncbi:MAG: hypothetical protein AB8B96_11975 [Lysobacterales bacterium]
MTLIFRAMATVLCLTSGIALADDLLPVNWVKAGSKPRHYDMGIATIGNSKVAYIMPAVNEPKPFGTLMQKISASDYKGTRIRLSARIRTIDALSAAMWMRVDGRKKPTLQFDNMHDRPITGSTDWAEYSIVLDVPQNAESIFFGVLSTGKGEVQFDDFTLETVNLSVPSTNSQRPSTKPENLDFEN